MTSSSTTRNDWLGAVVSLPSANGSGTPVGQRLHYSYTNLQTNSKSCRRRRQRWTSMNPEKTKASLKNPRPIHNLQLSIPVGEFPSTANWASSVQNVYEKLFMAFLENCQKCLKRCPRIFGGANA